MKSNSAGRNLLTNVSVVDGGFLPSSLHPASSSSVSLAAVRLSPPLPVRGQMKSAHPQMWQTGFNDRQKAISHLRARCGALIARAGH